MAWVYFDFVGQGEQLLVDTAVKLLRVSGARPGKSGRPTAPMNSVSSVNTNQGSVPASSPSPETHAFRVWPGVWMTLTCVFRSSIASPSRTALNGEKLRNLAIVQAVRRLDEARASRDRRSGDRRANMRVDDMGDPHLLAGCDGHVRVRIIGSCIDDGETTERGAAAEHVRGASVVEVVERVGRS